MPRDALLFLQTTMPQDSRSSKSVFFWRPGVASKSSSDVYSRAAVDMALAETKRPGGDTTAEEEIADPALIPFLMLLEADLAARPSEAVIAIPESLASRLDALANEIGEVDPEELIEGDVSV